jgi:hypothetical protein
MQPCGPTVQKTISLDQEITVKAVRWPNSYRNRAINFYDGPQIDGPLLILNGRSRPHPHFLIKKMQGSNLGLRIENELQ